MGVEVMRPGRPGGGGGPPGKGAMGVGRLGVVGVAPARKGGIGVTDASEGTASPVGQNKAWDRNNRKLFDYRFRIDKYTN